MSGDERDIDVESAEEVPDIGVEATANSDESHGNVPLDKRAHHNALERQRRDHIKDSFHSLRDCIPALHSEKVSRAHILNKATEYIRHLQKGGSLRENEISHLQRKNEVLEEQVCAIEAAQALGSSENTEEILTSVMEKVTNRQRQRQNSKSSDKSDDGKGVGGVKGSYRPSSGKQNNSAHTTDNRPASKGPAPEGEGGGSGGGGVPQLNSINLLASNLKSTQSLINALQSANVKHLAAKVLASPIGRQSQQGQAPSSAMPRGIVTATTVPTTGNPITAANLASALKQQQQFQKQQQQQQKQQSSKQGDAAPSSSSSSSSNTAWGNPPSQLKPTNTSSSSSSSSSTSAANAAVLAAKALRNALSEANSSETPKVALQPAVAQKATPASSTTSPRAKTSNPANATTATATAGKESTSTTMASPAGPKLSPALLSQASQLLAVNSLLQSQAGGMGVGQGGGANSPQLTQELLSQVTSFLNMSGGSSPSSTALSVPAEMVDKIEDDFDQLGTSGTASESDEVNPNSLLSPLPINAVLETIEPSPTTTAGPSKRPASDTASSPLAKKARLDKL